MSSRDISPPPHSLLRRLSDPAASGTLPPRALSTHHLQLLLKQAGTSLSSVFFQPLTSAWYWVTLNRQLHGHSVNSLPKMVRKTLSGKDGSPPKAWWKKLSVVPSKTVQAPSHVSQTTPRWKDQNPPRKQLRGPRPLGTGRAPAACYPYKPRTDARAVRSSLCEWALRPCPSVPGSDSLPLESLSRRRRERNE